MEAEQFADAIPGSDPFAVFDGWFAEACTREPDANAMALATATPDGLPSVRMVLLKGHGADLGAELGGGGGFVFYTNGHSRKGQEIRANPHAALLFHWKSLRRQVRIEGPLTPVPAAAADAYFASRARESQLGAVASDQSCPLDARASFIEAFEEAEARFAGREVERPAHWLGFRLVPTAIEFWLDRPYRLHERRLFTRERGDWSSTLLYP